MEISSVVSLTNESVKDSVKSSLSSSSADPQNVIKGSESQTESQRGRPKDRRVQKLNPSHFPILQGLSETNKRMSPKLPHGRPKGQEMTFHQSPSPVRKANTGYYVYPEPKLRNKSGMAREVSPVPNMFPDSDTSLFEKTPAMNTENFNNNSRNRVNVPAVNKRLSSDDDNHSLEQHANNNEINVKGNEQHQGKPVELSSNTATSPDSDDHEGTKRNELLNTNQSNNTCHNTNDSSLKADVGDGSECADGVTADGKVFYNV